MLLLRPAFSMRRTRMNQKGYTLIEMMLTVFIVAILVALVLPVVGAGVRERRKSQATHDAIRIFHRARSRAIESGSAYLVRYSKTANSNKGALYVVRGTTDHCNTSAFSTPVAAQCPSSSGSGDPNLICTDWWLPRDYEFAGSTYTIQLMHTSSASYSQSTASTMSDPDFCFEGNGVMRWRAGTSGYFSDVPVMPGTGGAQIPGGGFTFSVRTLVGSAERGVNRRFVVPFGAEARYVP